MVARSVVDVILGEAVGDSRSRSVSREERFQDMLAIASAISNRAVTSGVPAKDIVSVQREFNAYGKSLPSGAEKHRDLAERAWNQVQTQGPVHNGTFYAAPDAVKGLPEGLTQVATTAGHQFFSDPQGRAFNTALGYVTPDMSALSTGTRATSGPMAGMGASRFDFGGYAGLVPPTPVGLEEFSLPDTMEAPSGRPGGPGMGALAPNGLEPSAARGTPLSNYDRSGLHPSLYDVMDSVAGQFPGMPVNSGYRSPSGNRAAGGASRSQHMGGRALDLDIRGLSELDKARALDAATEKGAKGIGLYSSGNTMHVDTRANPTVWSDSYQGIPISAAPGWAQPGLKDMFAAGPFDVTPRGLVSDIPTPTSRPDPAQTAAMAGLGTGRPEGPLGGFPAASEALAPDRGMPSGPVSTGGLWDPIGALPTPSMPVEAPSIEQAPDRAMPSGPMSMPNLAPEISLPDFAPAPERAPSAFEAGERVGALAGMPSLPSTAPTPFGPPAPPISPVDTFANLPEFAPVPTSAPREAAAGLLAPPVGPVPSLAPPVASVPGASINPMRGSEPGRHNKAGFGDFAKGAAKGAMAAGLPGAVAGGVIGGLRGSRVENPGPGKTGPLGLGLLGTNRGGPLGLGILPGLASLFGGGGGFGSGLGGLFDGGVGFGSPDSIGGGFPTRGESGWDAPGYR